MAVILGINTLHAGASAALLIDGLPVAALAEERLNRQKYYAGFPARAIEACLAAAGITWREVDYLAVGRDPRANRPQKAFYALRHPARVLNLLRSGAARLDLNDLRPTIVESCGVPHADLRFRQVNVEHHLAHLASAFFASPYERAAGFSLDGSGDFVTCMLAACEGDALYPLRRLYMPHSLGWLYTMICQFIGFPNYGDEGKVMGLAPYGENSYKASFAEMLRLTGDGFRLNGRWFRFPGSARGESVTAGGEMVVDPLYSDHMIRIFGTPRPPTDPLTDRDRNLAQGVQATFERVYHHLLNSLHQLYPVNRVAMAGGGVLNSVANGQIFQKTPFRETFIQPAAGDEGLSLGAALYVARSICHEPNRYQMSHAYLGLGYSDSQIRAALDQSRLPYRECSPHELVEIAADQLAGGGIVGWFQGRMEWGPRALGARSILAHPGLPEMKDALNARIKRRESFRPFAPAVLAERQNDVFECGEPSPFMLHVYPIKAAWRERLAAVTHVDNSGRLQTVTEAANPLYYAVIRAFERRTGIPVLLNTSFNENEPIVCTPEEAVACFERTRMDGLAIGSFWCEKG